MGLIQSSDSLASEFPAQGLDAPSPTWWVDQMLILCGLGEGSGTSLAQGHAQHSRWWCRRQGSWSESSSFTGNSMASAVVRLSVRAAGSSQGFWVLMTCFLSGPLRLSVIMSLKISLKELESHCSVPREQRRNSLSEQVKGSVAFSEMVAHWKWEKKSRNLQFERLHDCYVDSQSKAGVIIKLHVTGQQA